LLPQSILVQDKKLIKIALEHNPYLSNGLGSNLKLLTTIQTIKSQDSSCVSHTVAVYLCKNK